MDRATATISSVISNAIHRAVCWGTRLSTTATASGNSTMAVYAIPSGLMYVDTMRRINVPSGSVRKKFSGSPAGP